MNARLIIAIILVFVVFVGWLIWDTTTLSRKTFFVDDTGAEKWCWANDFLDKWAGSGWCGLDKYQYGLAKNVGVTTGRMYEWRQLSDGTWRAIFLSDPNVPAECPTYVERPKLWYDWRKKSDR